MKGKKEERGREGQTDKGYQDGKKEKHFCTVGRTVRCYSYHVLSFPEILKCGLSHDP